MATCASLVDVQLTNNVAEDSFDISPAMQSQWKTKDAIRHHTLHQTNKLDLAIRQGKWKYLDHKGSGGNDYRRESLKPYALTEMEPDAPGQLYNLETDPGETANLSFVYPEVVEDLKKQLDAFRHSGRSAPPR